MLHINQLTLFFGERALFKDINLRFLSNNCYGIIGANGAGKSTFLKLLSKEMESSSGEIIKAKKSRLSFLRQDQSSFDEYTVLDTILQGYPRLYQLSKRREELYQKENFSESDGLLIAQIEEDFSLLGGYEIENQAAQILKGLGLDESYLVRDMKNLESKEKVRVLLAQAIFSSPDILLLDEPTNHLDLESIKWLEEFLINIEGVVLVASHDRHFLNQICTHILDIDFQDIKLYVGNYDFWYEMSHLIRQQQKDQKKQAETKAKELKSFIQRFSANAAKSRQATSRKKLLEKINLEDLPHSYRKFPYIQFQIKRNLGNNVLNVHDLSYETNQKELVQAINFNLHNHDKVIFLGPSTLKSQLFDILTTNSTQYEGRFKWGQTVHFSYFSKENQKLFQENISILDFLRQYSEDKSETYIRTFLGRMLFSGEDSLKKINILSGGERVRVLLSMLMLEQANVLILDEPTNHLDLEAITALNQALIQFPGALLFSSHDFQFIQSVANRVIELSPHGIIDRSINFEEYINSSSIKNLREKIQKNKKINWSE